LYPAAAKEAFKASMDISLIGGTPLDYISYHFYAIPTPDETLDIQQHTVFVNKEKQTPNTRRAHL
jgi:hypothetical protein